MYRFPKLQKLSRFFVIDSKNPDVIQRGRILQFIIGVLFLGNILRLSIHLVNNLQRGGGATALIWFGVQIVLFSIFTAFIYRLINHNRITLATHTYFFPLFIGELVMMFLSPQTAVLNAFVLLLYLASIASTIRFNQNAFYIFFCYIAALYLQLLDISTSQFLVTAMSITLVAWISTRAQKNTLKDALKASEELEILNRSLQEKVKEQTADLRHRNERLQFSLDVGRAASASLNLDKLLYNTAHLIRDEFGFYHVTIFLTDESGQYLVLKEATGVIGERQKVMGFEVKRGSHSIIGWVSGHRQARIARNVNQDEFFQTHPLLPKTRAELALPLLARNNLVGVIDMQSESIDSFTDEDVTILQLMADQLANNIENALLFTELQKRTAVLTELQLITNLMNQQPNTESTLHVLANRAKDLLAADGAGVFLWREDISELELALNLNLIGIATGQQINLEESLIGRCFTELKTISADGYKSETFSANPLAMQNMINVPLKERDKPIGVLTLVRKRREQPFSEEDIQTIELLAVQAGTIITNQQLIEKTQDLVRRERLLNQISAQVRNSLDAETVLDSAAQQLGQILGNQRVRISLFPPQK